MYHKFVTFLSEKFQLPITTITLIFISNHCRMRPPVFTSMKAQPSNPMPLVLDSLDSGIPSFNDYESLLDSCLDCFRAKIDSEAGVSSSDPQKEEGWRKEEGVKIS